MWENWYEGEFPCYVLSNLNVRSFEATSQQGDILCHAEYFICFVSVLACSNLVKYLVRKAGSPEKGIP